MKNKKMNITIQEEEKILPLQVISQRQNRDRKVSKSNESTRCIDCDNTTNMRKLSSGRKVPQWYIADKEKNLYQCKKCYSKYYCTAWRALNPEYGHVYYLFNKKHLLEYQRAWRAANPSYPMEYYYKNRERILQQASISRYNRYLV